jgi:hypothetical protein
MLTEGMRDWSMGWMSEELGSDSQWEQESFLFSTQYRVFIVQVYQTSQYVVPHGSIFLSKWHSSFTGNSDGKMNVQSACALNTQYMLL